MAVRNMNTSMICGLVNPFITNNNVTATSTTTSRGRGPPARERALPRKIHPRRGHFFSRGEIIKRAMREALNENFRVICGHFAKFRANYRVFLQIVVKNFQFRGEKLHFSKFFANILFSFDSKIVYRIIKLLIWSLI